MKFTNNFQTKRLNNRRAGTVGRKALISVPRKHKDKSVFCPTTIYMPLLFSLLMALVVSVAGYVERAEAGVPAIVSLDDIDSSGSPEVSVLLRDTADNKNYAYVNDAKFDTLIKKLEFGNLYTPLFQAVVPDFDDGSGGEPNGADEIAMLGVESAGYVRVHLKDASSGNLIKILGFGNGFTPVAMAVVPDINGNSKPEIAVLGFWDNADPQQDEVKVIIRDASSNAWINTLSFDVAYAPIAVAVVGNFADTSPKYTTAPEIAVLGVRASDGKVQVFMKDASTDASISPLGFDINFPPIVTPNAMAVVADMNGNGVDEIAVLGVNSTNGNVKVVLKDAYSTAVLGAVYFDSNFPPVDMAVVPDFTGNDSLNNWTTAPEIAVLGVGATGTSVENKVRVTIKDASSDSLIKIIYFDKNYPPVGMTVVPDFTGVVDDLANLDEKLFTSAPEIAVLGVSGTTNKLAIKDAFSAAMVNGFLVPSDVGGPSGDIIMVSVASDGTQGNSYSRDLSINANGRYVAFGSNASNLLGTSNGISNDTNGEFDTFVHDTETGVTTLLSVVNGSDGKQAQAKGGASKRPSISKNGRYVTFKSWATNLVKGDNNNYCDDSSHGVLDENCVDIFVRDRDAGKTTLVSLSSAGAQGDGKSVYPGISPDGRYVAFHSMAANFDDKCASLDGNGDVKRDVFVRDMSDSDQTKHTTTCISVDPSGNQGGWSLSYRPAISEGGQYVAFYSKARNLVTGDCTAPPYTTGDCNGKADVFVRDMSDSDPAKHTTTLVSVNSDEKQGDGDSYVNDVSNISITQYGRYVAFISDATNFVLGSDGTTYNGDTNGVADVFVHDRDTGKTTRVSVNSAGTGGNSDITGGRSDSKRPSISADGRYVSFISWATNLVLGSDGTYNGDTNGKADAFVHDTLTGITTRVSVAADGTQADYESKFSYISADGRYVAFWSWASNLVTNDKFSCDNNGDGNANENCTDVFRVFNPLYVVP